MPTVGDTPMSESLDLLSPPIMRGPNNIGKRKASLLELEEPPKKALTGHKYWGPGNSMHGQSTERLDNLEAISRRHDYDIAEYNKIKDNDLRKTELFGADYRFKRRIMKLYREGKITSAEMAASQLLIGPVSRNVYYPMIKKK